MKWKNAMDRRMEVLKLAAEVDDTYAQAASCECTCGSDPESGCSFCRQWERAEKKMKEFTTLVERGLGMD